MTFEKWEAVYRDDEANERFSSQRYDARPPHRRKRRIVVCGQCLREDAVPNLRRAWLIGWTAICLRHQCLLITHCKACHRKLSGESKTFSVPVSIDSCNACGSKLSEAATEVVPAHCSVLHLQEALLHGKREGFTELAGIGRLSWQETVALIDVVVGTFATNPIPDIYAHSIFLRQAFSDFDCTDAGYASARYRSLVLLGWFLEGWPNSYNAGVAKDLLRQWSVAERTRVSRHLDDKWEDAWDPGPYQIEAAIQYRLRQFLGS